MARCVAEELEELIRGISSGRERTIVAIDGRCAAGKTTLAAELRRRLDCTVFHMDDFFLRPVQRTAARLSTPGGNVDYERFAEEVLLPLRQGGDVVYRPYRCAAGRLGDAVTVTPDRIVLVEGCYACHPALRDSYDLRVMLTVAPEEQLRRLRLRDPQKAEMFRQKWIPLEELYFSSCGGPEAYDWIGRT